MTESTFDLNYDVWSRDEVAASYAANEQKLFQVEHAIFEVLESELKTARLLDIGIGAGRSTAHLKWRCRSYTGIDYSRPMISRAKARFPELELQVMDARGMSAFESDSFQAVVFTYNGIDYVSHDDRIRILQEIHRVLSDNGVFIFSTHNRNTKSIGAWSIRHLKILDGIGGIPERIVQTLTGIINSARVKKFERRENAYALLNDMGEQYRLLTYYICPQEQIAQLEQSGFSQIRLFSLDGKEMFLEKVGEAPMDFMLHFVTRKTRLEQTA